MEMKKVFFLFIGALLLSGCVSRTITVEPEHRGAKPSKKSKKYGSDPEGKFVDKKLVWIWQKEYREYK
jgi:PBP1b-binding outer membrane lipoprotein LpoB